MRKVLLLSGPNLNLLGQRDPAQYGTLTLAELEDKARAWGLDLGLEVTPFQSNHEGALIDALQEARAWAAGAVVNPGALTHYSYALHDALVDFARPVIEVHLSKVSEREAWRRVSVVRPACRAHIEGLGTEGYRVALQQLAALLG
jgi:3-dehydroquinate dehydratase-2